MKKLNFSHQFINWTLITMKIVSYKFQVNGEHSNLVEAKRGLRQGDHISPLLFAIVMEYLQRILPKLKSKSNFNFHSNREKMAIITWVVMQAFEDFSKATRLKVNPSKCKVFFGNVGNDEKQRIQKIANFIEGSLPFKYLGIHLTNVCLRKFCLELTIGVLGCCLLQVELN